MDISQAPVGVFDSGVGGISVLRELVKLMPNENYIYFLYTKHHQIVQSLCQLPLKSLFWEKVQFHAAVLAHQDVFFRYL